MTIIASSQLDLEFLDLDEPGAWFLIACKEHARYYSGKEMCRNRIDWYWPDEECWGSISCWRDLNHKGPCVALSKSLGHKPWYAHVVTWYA